MDEIFRILIENSSIPVWIKDLELNYIFVNNKYKEITNKVNVDFIGFKNEDIFDENTCNTYNESCRLVMDTLKPKSLFVYVDCEYKECGIVPIINDNKELVAIAGMIYTITEAYKVKEKDMELEKQRNLTNQIMDILPGVIFYKDEDGRYIYANKECRDFNKLRGIDNIIGKTDIEINPNKKLVEKFLHDDAIISATKTSIFNEVIFENPDGTKNYREVVKMPLIDGIGNILGIVGRSIDITEKVIAQERLKYLSYTDILTEVNNKTSFEERAEELSKESYLPLGLIMGDANGLKLVNDTFGHQVGDELLIEIAKVLKDVCKDIGEVFRIGGDEFVILIPNASLKYCENIIKKIINRCGECENHLFNISISLGSSIKKTKAKELYEVFKEAEDKVYRQKLLQKGSIKSSILNSLKIGLGTKSLETKEHTDRVILSAVKVGKILELEMSEIDELRIVADLHDIGKIGIPEDVLIKPGKLTNNEYEMMKMHSEKGYRIIRASSELQNVAQGVLYHHERWDGKGYPMGLKGEEIPIISRIVSVSDAYDVMTSDRIYKKAINSEEAIEEIKRCSGTQFDPRVVEAFLEFLKRL
ncbi:MAG: diguanylate cyclase [Clostridium sp.]|uniref:HD domain-containing phosphohydrolase n=1 Tax=Clostridium sp. TaxID=1506 RepID=UPI00304C23C3